MTHDEQIEPVWLDRGPGSGSLTWEESHYDTTARRSPHDGRSITRTTFYGNNDLDDPNEHTTWERLASFNDDMYHPDRSSQNHESDKRRTLTILCNELDCTEYQHDRSTWVLDELDNLREFSPTTKMESIMVAVISLVVDEETTDFDNRISNRDEFKRLLDDLDMTFSDLWALRRKVREHTMTFEDR